MGGYLFLGWSFVRFSKPPTPISAQIKLLHDRGMKVGNIEEAGHYLSHISYYRMTSYWLPFEADHATHRFKPGTTFDHILNLYIFDRELRLLVMDAIERIEISLRTKWMNILVDEGGPHAHLDRKLFAIPKSRDRWSYYRAVASLVAEAERSKEIFVKHLMHKYDEDLPPLWACCELMTFGVFSKWYANTLGNLRNKVSRSYGLDEAILTSFLHHLTVIRNLCAHHGRLWNREFTFTWKLPKKNPKNLVPNVRRSETRRIYNSLVMLGFLMDQINPNSLWKERLCCLVDKHKVDTALMGFPEDFQDYPIWSR